MAQSTQDIPADTARLLHGVDASRRAGWARFYAEASKVDELSKDYNLAREDARLFARAFSFLFGFADQLVEFTDPAVDARLFRALRGHLGRFQNVTLTRDVRHGREAATALLQLHAGGKQQGRANVDRLLIREKQQGIRKGRRDTIEQLVLDGVLSEELAEQYDPTRRADPRDVT